MTKTMTFAIIAAATLAASALAIGPGDPCERQALRVWTLEQVRNVEPVSGSDAEDAQWFLAGCRVGLGLR